MSANPIISSHQWFTSLDSIIDAAIEMLLDRTTLVEHYASQLVNYQNAHKKRHISLGQTWIPTISNLANFLAAPSITSFKEIQLDRGYKLAMLENFGRITVGYNECYVKAFKRKKLRLTSLNVRLNDYHRRVGLKEGHDLVQLISHVAYLHIEAVKLKHALLKNYEGYIEAVARIDAKNHPLAVESNDLFQSYYLAANRAIDHFNIDRGTFKSYLDVWLKKSRNGEHNHYGSAYTVPSGVKANHLYVPIDSLDEEASSSEDSPHDIVNTKQETLIIRKLALMVDPGGYASQALELGD